MKFSRWFMVVYVRREIIATLHNPYNITISHSKTSETLFVKVLSKGDKEIQR